MVLADATLMLLIINPNAPVPGNGQGVAVDRVKERIDHLVDRLENAHQRILVPTPVLSEILVRTRSSAEGVLEKLNKYACFEICPFDTLAAVELGEMTRKEVGNKKLSAVLTYAKLKFDRQIVAIAKVRNAKAIYSDDGHVRTIGRAVGIPVFGVRDLPLPPSKQGGEEGKDHQSDLFKPPDEEP